MFRKIFCFVSFSLLPVTVACSQLSVDTLYALPEVTIVATRFTLSPDALPARVTRLDRALIERYPEHSLSAILERDGGGFVRRYGPGGLAGISIRGSSPTHTAILLDGQPVTDPQLGQVDLSLLPTVFLSAVEQLHGGGSSRFGSDAIGGAINLSTLVPERSSIRLTTLAGAWGERSAGATGMLMGSNTDVTVAAEVAKEDGDFSFLDRSNFPTRRSERSNADRESVNVFFKARHRRSRTLTELAGWLASVERGLPSIGGNPSPGERQWDRLFRVWLAQHWQSSTGSTTVQASVQRMSIRYANPAIGVDDEGLTRSLTIGVSRDQRISRALRLIVGADAGRQTASHPSLDDGAAQTMSAIYASAQARAGRGISFFPSVRSDWFRRDGHVVNSVNPALRVRMKLGNEGVLAVKSGVERTFRIPTFNDLHWRGANARGNSGLLPERGVSADLGFAMESDRFSGEVTAFYQSTRNRISWLPDESGTWRPENIGTARSFGLESSGKRTVVLGAVVMTISAGYEFVNATDRSSKASETYGKPLRYVPRHTVRTGADFVGRHMSAGLSVRAVGRRYVTEDASSWLSPYAVVDARVASRFNIGTTALRLTAALENVGSSDYQIVSGYPMPPRHLRLQLAVTI